MLTVEVRDREFLRALDEIAFSSRRDDREVLTGQAIQLVRVLVTRTRLAMQSAKKGSRRKRYKFTGRARAGWWPSWLPLGVFSVPRGTSSKVLSDAEGSFVDGRHGRGEIFVEMTNSVPYIDTLDAEDDILEGAYANRAQDMEGALDRRYGRMLQRKSGI